MKKTSLMLAISALLYGTSAAYVLAEDGVLHANMTPDEVKAYLDSLPPEPDAPADVADGLTEGGEGPAGILGLEPFPELPSNVHVDSSRPIKSHHMCSRSFQVNGYNMAEFPVEVTRGDGMVTEAIWNNLGMLDEITGYASGPGWLIVQSDDTWYLDHPWKLYTWGGTTVTKIVLKPIIDSDGDYIRYAFDIGGLTGDVPEDEHTAGAARGRYIKMLLPPNVDFDAYYSRPVYVMNPDVDPEDDDLHADSGNASGMDGNNVHEDSDTPTHDLYGVLTIEFSTPVAGAELSPAFRFVADTDCLPVREAKIESYDADSGIVNLTLLGSGLSYIEESCPDGTQAIPGATFDVQGRAQVSAVVMPMSGCCYSLVDVDTGQNVRLLGLDGPGNGTDEVCMP